MKDEVKETTTAITRTAFAAVRRELGSGEYISIKSISLAPMLVIRQVEEANAARPSWAIDRPLQRIVKVRVEEIPE